MTIFAHIFPPPVIMHLIKCHTTNFISSSGVAEFMKANGNDYVFFTTLLYYISPSTTAGFAEYNYRNMAITF